MTVSQDHERHGSDEDLGSFLSPASFWLPEHIVESAWLQHAPFAFWLVQALRPSRIVELGTHRGFSYLAFCQAVRRLKLETRCFAVDTWQGDEHAGRYSENVLQQLKSYHDPRFSDFSRLVRGRFDEVAKHFDDHSVDLLHIDGRHFYGDVKEDFEIWRPKLSRRSVVLFHDTNVRERGFGVWRLWAEIAKTAPSFEFLHGHGLGVLGTGPELPPGLLAFFRDAANARETVREVYFRLGSAIEDRQNAAGRVVLKTTPVRSVHAAPVAAASAPGAADLHIHLAVMAPRFLDVRTYLPLRALAEVPGIATSTSERGIELPRLPAGQPKVAIVQRVLINDPATYRDAVVTMVRKGWIIIAEVDDHPALMRQVFDRTMDDSAWDAMRMVHAVQTSTPRLADAIRPFNPEVAAFPNAAFTAIDEVPPAPRNGKTIRVFYGALNRERYSALIGAALAPLADSRPDVEFVVVHDRAFFDALGNANKIFSAALGYDDYLKLMGTCDIALMPLEGTPNESFKSDIKFVEASSLGLASVVSPGVYGQSVRHDETGLIADVPERWTEALDRLISAESIRLMLAKAAHAEIVRDRMFVDQIDARLTWYRELWARRHALTKSLQQRLGAYAQSA